MRFTKDVVFENPERIRRYDNGAGVTGGSRPGFFKREGARQVVRLQTGTCFFRAPARVNRKVQAELAQKLLAPWRR
jgi:hypothetical protein